MESMIQPLVSVVLNTRNRSNLLPRAIKSVLNQTYDNYEILIIDGASTDETRRVSEEYCKLDSRIKYIYIPENKNAAYCINIGFSKAKGKYIAILDDDDEFLPTKLYKQVNLMEEKGEQLGIVYCWEEFWDDSKNIHIKFGKEESRGALYSKLLYGPCTGGGTLMLVRKEAINKIGGGYDETIRFGADYQFNLNISEYYEHDFIPEVLVKTHWFHEYVHLTTQKGGIINYEAVIEYYEKILLDHKNSFEKDSKAKLWHYKSIISAASHIKKYRVIYIYISKTFKTKASSIEKIKLIFFALKRSFISLVKNK